jgi:uncharacterized RDD family membrane protein YckC
MIGGPIFMKKSFFLDKIPASWTRVCAQLTDYAIFYLVFALSTLLAPFYVEELYSLLFVVLLPLLWAPVEALLVSRFKTTPGKSLFGIRVESHVGGKIPFLIALKRALFFGIRPGVIRQKTVSTLRKGMAIMALLGLIGTATFEKEISMLATGFEKGETIDGWVDYTSSGDEFHVLLPETPKETTNVLPVPDQDATLNYEEVKSHQTKKIYYSISYMKLPGKWKLAGASRLLQGALDLIVQHTPGSKVFFKNFTKHGNHRAIDFHMTQEGGEEVKGRLILVGMTLYRLTVVYPSELASKTQHQEFIDSFEVNS